MHRKIIASLVISAALSSCTTPATADGGATLCLQLTYTAANRPLAKGVTLVNVDLPPTNLVLQNVPHPSFVPNSGYKVVKAFVPVDKLYEGANWIEHDGTIEIDWGTGLGGVIIKLRNAGNLTYIGSANTYTDLPDPKIQFQEFYVKASRVACGQHGLTIRSSRTHFAPPTTWQKELAMLLAPLRKSA